MNFFDVLLCHRTLVKLLIKCISRKSDEVKMCRRVMLLVVTFPFWGSMIHGSFSATGTDPLSFRQSLCGPYSLTVIAEMYGIQTDLTTLSELSKTTQKGTSMKNLVDAAHQLGLKSRGMKVSLDYLLRKVTLPVIAYVNMNHYVVVEKIIGDQMRIIESPDSTRMMPISKFAKIWGGHIITISSPSTRSELQQPKIHADKLLYDFGVLKEHKTVKHDFIIRNVGAKPLEIRDIQPDCNCSHAEISLRTILPGKQAQLHLEFDTAGIWGRQTTSAKVISNDPNQPVIRVSMSGHVVTAIPISPPKVELGTLYDSAVIHRQIQLRDPGNDKLKIKGVKTSSKNIKAVLIQQGEDFIIKLSIKPTASRDSINIKEYVLISTNNELTPKIKVPILGQFGGPFKVFPAQFFFGIVSHEKVYLRKVSLTASETPNWHVVRAECQLPEASMEVRPIKEGKHYSILMTLSPRTSKGSLQGTVHIYTTHPKQSLVKIPVYAILK